MNLNGNLAVQVFQLVDPKELTPLQELIDTIIR